MIYETKSSYKYNFSQKYLHQGGHIELKDEFFKPN